MKSITNTRRTKMKIAGLTALALAAMTSSSAVAADNDNDRDDFKFDLERAPGLINFPTVAPHARGEVRIRTHGQNNIMDVKVWGLPPNTAFDLFVTQVPNFPFGMSWYQGDIVTNKNGVGSAEFIGQFNIETFMVAPGVAPAPADPFDDPSRILDAAQNPKTNPIQMYHLGLWFDNPKDVEKLGGPGTVTPFNGEHDAGILVLNTAQFSDTEGPLKRFTNGDN
jgi:hypothetical protein